MSPALRNSFLVLWIACTAGGAAAAMQTNLAVSWIGLTMICLAGLALVRFEHVQTATAKRVVRPGIPPRTARFRNLPHA
ncbi:hypothetical protein AB9K41_26515 [Cribrihabitans sp. XS_ASV171]